MYTLNDKIKEGTEENEGYFVSCARKQHDWLPGSPFWIKVTVRKGLVKNSRLFTENEIMDGTKRHLNTMKNSIDKFIKERASLCDYDAHVV